MWYVFEDYIIHVFSLYSVAHIEGVVTFLQALSFSDVNDNKNKKKKILLQKLKLLWPVDFTEEDFKAFLYKFKCKNSTPIVPQPYPKGSWFEQTKFYIT